MIAKKLSAGEPVRKRGRPRTIDQEERRLSILQGAHEAFVELGFARTTTAIVAARAKVSKRSIYEVFADKTELFAAVVREHRHLVLDLPRPADEDLPPLQALTLIFRLDLDDEADRAREAMLNLITRESVLFPELSDYLYAHEVIRSREDLIDWLQSQTVLGSVSIEKARLHAGMLMDIVFGALLPRRRLRDRAEREIRNAHIKERLAIFLLGVNATRR